MIYEIIPFHKPIFSYTWDNGIHIADDSLFCLLAHHMFATGMSFTENSIHDRHVPVSAMHIFNWEKDNVGRQNPIQSTNCICGWWDHNFLLAGAGGVVNSAMPLDFLTHDSYWVVGHMHLFLMGIITLHLWAFIYYLFPLITGRMAQRKVSYDSILAYVYRSIPSIRYTALAWTAWHASSCSRLCACWTAIMMNQISTVGVYILLVGMGIFLFNLIKSAGWGKPQIWKIHLVLERSIMTIDGVSHTTKDRERKRWVRMTHTKIKNQ